MLLGFLEHECRRWLSNRFQEWDVKLDPHFMSRWIKQYGFQLMDVRIARNKGSFSWLSIDRCFLICIRDAMDSVYDVSSKEGTEIISKMDALLREECLREWRPAHSATMMAMTQVSQIASERYYSWYRMDKRINRAIEDQGAQGLFVNSLLGYLPTSHQQLPNKSPRKSPNSYRKVTNK